MCKNTLLPTFRWEVELDTYTETVHLYGHSEQDICLVGPLTTERNALALLCLLWDKDSLKNSLLILLQPLFSDI